MEHRMATACQLQTCHKWSLLFLEGCNHGHWVTLIVGVVKKAKNKYPMHTISAMYSKTWDNMAIMSQCTLSASSGAKKQIVLRKP